MDKQWTARWITDREFAALPPIDLYHKELNNRDRSYRHREELQNRHMLARKEFTLDGSISLVGACLDITGDDYYKVYVNGCFVGQGPAQGNAFHYYYNRFEIASFLNCGLNAIAVHVYYHGLISHAYNSGDYRQGFIAELTIGGQAAVITDGSWKYRITEEYGNGSVIAYDTQFAEHVDNRLKAHGWREIGFDDSDWSAAAVLKNDDHQLFLQPTPPLAVYDIPPSHVTELAGNLYRIDFGHEITGQFRLRARGEEGQVVEIRCGEELLDNGRVRYEMRCNCLYQDFWTLSGRADDELELFDYKAFRYVEVIAEKGVSLDMGSFSAVVRHYPMDDGGGLVRIVRPYVERHLVHMPKRHQIRLPGNICGLSFP
ncbi:family 78 glycoside hydrolase catalytic domain [Paenibacillus ginsengarvi]|uniref:family 78 glycoside hydrolase catalytic domain n=1 Tax=Paenibacillus ginsengarvi TaxID=400777 RepID=UPI001EFFB36E|nr:family 78 glycoside hydrolase catalytic domain [Paenibacillus ginsengarvi]